MAGLSELFRNLFIVGATLLWLRSFIGSEVAFWMAWIIIPIVMEIIPAFFNFFLLLNRKKKKDRALGNVSYEAGISLIIPVFNSADSLYRCLASIYRQSYPLARINIILSNSGSTDDSFGEFVRAQKDFPEMTMTWVEAKQGKSKALNLALFSSDSKYIMHIDSDGVLERDAFRYMVHFFENRLDVDSATGAIIVNPELVEDTPGFLKRFMRRLEFAEYCQAFLAGRNFQAEFNAIYTMSGAFSAFRKSAILATQLFNTATVSEDTHLTFQLREALGSKLEICDQALFFVDPIVDVNTLYIQRQRWQRGEVEVTHLFMWDKMFNPKGILTNLVLRIVLYDHTFAFPRMIWYFALLCLAFLNYPMRLIVISVILIYILYVLSGWLYYFNIRQFLEAHEELRRYYSKKWYLVFFLPLFNFMVFWFRFAGIINSITGQSSWQTMNLTEELAVMSAVMRKDFRWLRAGRDRLKELVNRPQEQEAGQAGADR